MQGLTQLVSSHTSLRSIPCFDKMTLLYCVNNPWDIGLQQTSGLSLYHCRQSELLTWRSKLIDTSMHGLHVGDVRPVVCKSYEL